jgi:hypothetical protein
MTQEQFTELVHRFESESKQNPAGYKLKVRLFGWLGNIVFFGSLILSIALVAFGLYMIISGNPRASAVRIIIGFGLLAIYIARSIYVQNDKPEGISLKNKFPQLHAEVEAIRQKVNGPAIHDILLVDDVNAAIVQHPRFGSFGGYENYLIVGLQLMQSLTHEQFKAVIAHEFGHFVGGHGKFGIQVYFQRMRWAQLLEAFEKRDPENNNIFSKFVSWYTPRFDARTFVLVRQHEFDADKVSAQATSAATSAQALHAVNIADVVTQHNFWPNLWSKVSHQALAPQQIYAAHQAWVKQNWLDQQQQQVFLGQLAQQDTEIEDTHPAFRERIAALGQAIAPVDAPQQSAAEAIFGNELNAVQALLDAEWHQAADASWQVQYQQRQQLKQREQEIETNSQASNDELLELGKIKLHLHEDNAAALSIFERILKNEPNHATALYYSGVCRLNMGDSRGTDLLKKAAELKPQIAKHCYESLAGYYYENNDLVQAEQYKDKYFQRLLQDQKDEEERRSIKTHDTLLSPDLPEELRQTFQNQLKQHPDIAEAYLVRKQMPFDANELLPLLLIIPIKSGKGQKRITKNNDELNEQLIPLLQKHVDLEFNIIIFGENSPNATPEALQKYRSIPQARII